MVVLTGLIDSRPVQADASAPFGLNWGMKKEDLEARGVSLRPLFTEGPEVRFAVGRLPKMLSDTREAILHFGANNRLHRIEARSQDFRYDDDGSQLKARYDALSAVLSEKYGKGEKHHDISVTWSKPSDFLMGIYRGSSNYYTIFNDRDVRVRLEILATRRSVGHHVLIFDYKGIEDRDGGLSREREIL